MISTLQFNGSIPQHYQDLLTPFLFDGFSEDLVKRINFEHLHDLLELASGTGSLTKRLLDSMPETGHLLATDLEEGMLEVAQAQLQGDNLSWDVVDMTNIPYVNAQFDTIVCQFGLMLVPEKLKALQEMHRVLKPGGRLLFSVWADIADNPVWQISGAVIAGFLGANPMLQIPGPFSMSAPSHTLSMLKEAGFKHSETNLVSLQGSIENAAAAARGIVQGLPVFMAISKKDPTLVYKIEEALAASLAEQLGKYPLVSPLSAWVFETTK